MHEQRPATAQFQAMHLKRSTHDVRKQGYRTFPSEKRSRDLPCPHIRVYPELLGANISSVSIHVSITDAHQVSLRLKIMRRFDNMVFSRFGLDCECERDRRAGHRLQVVTNYAASG